MNSVSSLADRQLNRQTDTVNRVIRLKKLSVESIFSDWSIIHSGSSLRPEYFTVRWSDGGKNSSLPHFHKWAVLQSHAVWIHFGKSTLRKASSFLKDWTSVVCVVAAMISQKNPVAVRTYFTATTRVGINGYCWGLSQEGKRSDSENISLIHHFREVLHLKDRRFH